MFDVVIVFDVGAGSTESQLSFVATREQPKIFANKDSMNFFGLTVYMLPYFFWSEQILDGMAVGNKRLKLADVLPRAWEQKAVGVTEAALAGEKEEEEDNDGEDNAMAEDGSGDENEKKVLEPYRNVTQVVTPLADLSYEDQLAKKKEEIIQILKRLVRPPPNISKNFA